LLKFEVGISKVSTWIKYYYIIQRVREAKERATTPAERESSVTEGVFRISVILNFGDWRNRNVPMTLQM